MNLLHQPIFWGFCGGLLLGLIGCGFLLVHFWNSRGENKRLKRHLADKLELEADATNRLKTDLQNYKQQNENLRIKVANLNQLPDRRLQRELEIFARAERLMVAKSPGFPAVWEEAKRNAVEDLQQEEEGRSLPKRVFNALLNRAPASKMDETEIQGK